MSDARPSATRWAAHPALPDLLLALALVAVLGALTLSGAQGLHWSTGELATLITAFAVLHATVAVRNRAPATAFALASLAMLAVALVPDAHVTTAQSNGPHRLTALFLPSSLVFLVLLHTAASRLPRRTNRAALAVALAGSVLAGVRMASTLEDVAGTGWLVPVYVGIGLAVTVLATWWLGRQSAARRARAVAEREEATRLAVLEERARIAREMHDIVAHSLAVIVRQAEGGGYVAATNPDAAATALRTIADTGRDALTDMRGLLRVLREPDVAEPAAAQPGLADLPDLVARVRDTGVRVELAESGQPFPVGAATGLAGYRLAQEGVTNAVKHAGPGARVTVEVRWHADGVAVEVTDDGGGAAGSMPGAGAGLRGLHDRVAAVGGTFTAEPLSPGFRLRARFPRTAERSPAERVPR